MKSLITTLALIALAHSPLLAADPQPVKLIFDTDMGNDIDDAMALAMIHTLERRGAVELLAVTSTKDTPLSAAFIDALNTFYGAPDVPVGAVRNGVTPEIGKYLPLANEKDSSGKFIFPHDLLSGVDAPDATGLLRKTLAGQPDGSVTIAQVGFFTNLARLLASKPDDHSPLDGTALVKTKVKSLVIMAGAFQTIDFNNRFTEYNVKMDVPAAQDFVTQWPGEVVWSGFEIGIAAAYPHRSIQEDFGYAHRHPIKDGYLAYVDRPDHDRPTWDLTAVLYALYPDHGYFGTSPRGNVKVEDDGATFFQPHGDGLHRYLTMDAFQAARVREAFVQLVVNPPR